MPPKKRRGSGWERRPTSKDTLFGQLPPPEEVRASLVAAGGTTHGLTGDGLHWQVPIEEPPAETRWQDTPTPPNEVRRSQQSNHACASPCHHISRRDHSCGLAG